jgi:hypothetical protein
MIENTNMNRRWKGEEDLCMVYGLRWIHETINCLGW